MTAHVGASRTATTERRTSGGSAAAGATRPDATGAPTSPTLDGVTSVEAVQPINPNATTQARNLLSYLAGQYGHRILSGQQESTWTGGPEYEMDYIFENTGKYPAIRGLDYGDSKDFSSRAIEWWNAGGIPMVGWHLGAPTKEETYAGTQMSVSIDNVLTPGTAEHASFIQRLDGAAAQLRKLEEADVAVIWRPLHEAGGSWFWWSMEGGAQYQRLWKFEYDYLTNTKGLNNLIWLFGLNGSPDPSFSPGKAYYDVIGADTYAGDGNDDPLLSLYNSVKSIDSSTPIALHENGPIPDPDRMQSSGARWLLFATWHGAHLTQSNSVDHLRTVYGHSYVVTRDEVPNLR